MLSWIETKSDLFPTIVGLTPRHASLPGHGKGSTGLNFFKAAARIAVKIPLFSVSDALDALSSVLEAIHVRSRSGRLANSEHYRVDGSSPEGTVRSDT